MDDRRCLFVYGTLRAAGAGSPAAKGPAARRLAAEATPLGAARARGRLYHLGSYPGLVSGGCQDGWVRGEVLRLHRPEQTLAWLDRYEGGEYRRSARYVWLADGRRLQCWLYRYVAALPRRGRRIASGDWLARA